MAQSSSNITGRTQKLPEMPAPPMKIHYEEEGVQENANYQVHWSNWMSDGQQKSFYKHVFVLLLSWHPKCDDMAVDKEVERLKLVFEEKYNYNVESVLIDSRLPALPQIQANQAVANFVATNDREDALFIVYYAGHGSPGKERGDLRMSARRKQETKQTSQEFTHLTWNLVESSLKITRADVFLIFDCCHASDLGREAALTSRSFEYLAASTTNYTRSPGKQSFTSALIWALEQLAQASPMFTTSKLAKMICDSPNFPIDQKPSLTTRDIEAWQHIVLAPLPGGDGSGLTPVINTEDDDDEEGDDENDKPIPQSISLTFDFRHKQDEAELKKLADHLKKFMKLDNNSLLKVQWGGSWGGLRSPPGHRLRQAVFKIISQSTASRLKKGKFPSSHVRCDRLAPQMPQDERTPLLSDTSSITLEEEEEEEASTFPSLWDRISSFCRSLWKVGLEAPKVQCSNTTSAESRKTSKKWTIRFVDRILKLFRVTSPRIHVSS